MRKKLGVLEVVTDQFNLLDHGRSDGNGRGYLVDSVKRVISSDFFKERKRLGELFGYFGHELRQLSDKMDLQDTVIINYNGKPVAVEVIPSNRTIDMTIDDNGIVTHTQEILDTPTGRAVQAMRNAGAGGWSWAVKAVPTVKGAIARTFHGFDWVKHPSYIDMGKQQAMFESVGVDNEDDLLVNMFEGIGFDSDGAKVLLNAWKSRVPSAQELEGANLEIMMLESLVSSREAELAIELAAKSQREMRITQALGHLPIFTSQRQIQALCSMADDEDRSIVVSLFESVAKSMGDLPLTGSRHNTVKPTMSNKAVDDEVAANTIRFDNGGKKAFPFKRA